MKTISKLFLLLLALTPLVSAGVPRGYDPTTEFEEAKQEAISKKKLITILFKGSDDNCPNCSATVENGEKAAKSSSVMMFTRVSDFQKKTTGLPDEVLSKVSGLANGASVYFYVFNPNTLELVATGSRKELQTDKKAIKAFKDKIRAARKELK